MNLLHARILYPDALLVLFCLALHNMTIPVYYLLLYGLFSFDRFCCNIGFDVHVMQSAKPIGVFI